MPIAEPEPVFHQHDYFMTPIPILTIWYYPNGLVGLKNVHEFRGVRSTRDAAYDAGGRNRNMFKESNDADDRYGYRQEERLPSKAVPLGRCLQLLQRLG